MRGRRPGRCTRLQGDWFARAKRVSFVPMTNRYCFMIRFPMVCVCIALLAACSAAQTGQEPPQAADTAAPPVIDTGQEPSPAATDEDVMYRVFAAEVMGSEGNLEGAVGEYLEAALESDDPALAMRATRIAFAAQAWQQASMAADRWAVLDPSSVAARESAALAMLATGDYAGAELQLGKILELSDDRSRAWALVSGLLGRSASPDKADSVLGSLLEQYGEEGAAVAFHARSQLAVRNGEMQQAYQWAARAAELEPQRVEFLAWAGRVALNLGDRAAGLDYLRQAWELKPDDHDLTLAYADLLARNGQEDAARKVMADMEQTPDVMLTRILFELADGDLGAAMALYDRFRGMTFEDSSEKAYFQAQAAEAMELANDAIEFYGQVGEGDYRAPSIARRAELLALRGDVEEARTLLLSLREEGEGPVVEESWMTEARILQQTGDPEGAMEVLGEALEAYSDSIPLRYSRALVAAQLRRVEPAERDLRHILGLEPENAAALNALGYTLADQTDRYLEAEDLIHRAYALQPDDASITDSMGWIAYRLGRLEEAAEYLDRAWAMDDNPEIAAHLGEVLWQLGRLEEAREVWRSGLAVDSANSILNETIDRLESGL